MNVTLTPLHFSVRQILKPRNNHDAQVRDDLLQNLDLIYSAGLFDYLNDEVARRLLHDLWLRLRPSGRMLHGNLVVAPIRPGCSTSSSTGDCYTEPRIPFSP